MRNTEEQVRGSHIVGKFVLCLCKGHVWVWGCSLTWKSRNGYFASWAPRWILLTFQLRTFSLRHGASDASRWEGQWGNYITRKSVIENVSKIGKPVGKSCKQLKYICVPIKTITMYELILVFWKCQKYSTLSTLLIFSRFGEGIKPVLGYFCSGALDDESVSIPPGSVPKENVCQVWATSIKETPCLEDVEVMAIWIDFRNISFNPYEPKSYFSLSILLSGLHRGS